MKRPMAFSKHVCPFDTPFKCDNGQCCRPDQFCGEFSEECEGCFPLDVTDTLEWCREKGIHNASLFRHGACYGACFYRHSELLWTEPVECTEKIVPFIVGAICTVLVIAMLWLCGHFMYHLNQKKITRLSASLKRTLQRHRIFRRGSSSHGENPTGEAEMETNFNLMDERNQTSVMQPYPCTQDTRPVHPRGESATGQNVEPCPDSPPRGQASSSRPSRAFSEAENYVDKPYNPDCTNDYVYQ